MKPYRQITSEERYMLSALKMQGLNCAQIARQLGRHRSTIGRELKRNGCSDGRYRVTKAISRTKRRRYTSRRRWHLQDWQLQIVVSLLRLDWSPEQISGWLAKYRIVRVSHETIYRFIWYDRMCNGTLYLHLRQAGKRRRKRYGAYDSRGVLAGKRQLHERPKGALNRSRIGHFEIDTVMGASNESDCIVTLVDRRSKYTIIGKLKDRTVAACNQRLRALIASHQRKIRTLTADNGTEFHGYKDVERDTGARFYFAPPYHSWERGLNENTNGLIRQYLPKGMSMADIKQSDCDVIATRLNRRPRKTLGYLTPEQVHLRTT